MDDFPPYPAGLRLAGRDVLVVGGGHVAQRRVPALLAAGAVVTVVSPEVTPALEGLVGGGEVRWLRRRFETGDLDGAWYAIAATDDHEANELVGAAAEERRIFCVRADDATQASAWTPAVGRHAGVTVAVLANREPRRSAAVRDEILEGLREGTIVARHQRHRPSGVVLVGGGPGDPDLMSVAGRKALMEADVVVADRLAPRELLSELPSDVELVDVAKLPRGRSAQQEEINRIIVARALEGKCVVRFKGGDNFVFGRGYEEVLACREAGVPVTVIPGLDESGGGARGRRDPGHPPRRRPRVHGGLRAPAAGAPAIPGQLVGGGRHERHRRPDDGGAQRPRDRRGAHGRRPARLHTGGDRLRRHDAHRAHRRLLAGLAEGGPGRPGGAGPGDHRGRRGGAGGPSATLLLMSQLIEISDPADPRLADYRDLRDVELRKHLEAEHGLFLAEGEKVVRRAVEGGHAPRSFLMAPRWLDGLGDVLERTDAPCYVVSEALAEQVTGFHVHRGALASLERRPLPSVQSVLAGARSVLVLEDIVDHTNVGAIFRSGAALGFDAVLLAPRCADPLYRRAIKVAMGAVFSLPYARVDDWYDALPQLSAAGFTTVALTLADDAVPIDEAVAGLDRVALVLGSEGHGLSARWQQAADRRAIIPMQAGIDSLNVAAATAVACYVTARR